VINYQCPEDEKTYVHRIGRTARAGADGISVTFVDWDDLARWKMIDTALTLGLGEPEETYSSSEHLYEMLNIPAGSSGRMVKAKPVSEAPRKEPAKSSPTKDKSAKEKPVGEKSEDRTARVRTRTKKFTS
jgi:superfamily II DNA/RNA helicase